MRIILTKATKILGHIMPVGTILTVTHQKAEELKAVSKEFTEELPQYVLSRKKRKIDLSQLKT